MSRYVVVGGAGFIGSHLVDALSRSSDEAALMAVGEIAREILL